MPRKARVESKTKIYHVMSRAFAIFPFGYPDEQREQQNRFDESRIHYVK